jgi:hypothetical protein
MQLNLEGVGEDTLTVWIPSDLWRLRIRLTVGDSQGDTWTGYIDQKFYGPPVWSGSIPESCSGGVDQSVATFTDGSVSGPDKYWRHDVCDWSRQYTSTPNPPGF